MAAVATIFAATACRIGMLSAAQSVRRALIAQRSISTVEAGTAYENLVVGAFNRMGARFERVGGASDQGIDFRGPWALPGQPPFYVVGQCKHYERKKIGPSVIREWEGVMSRQETDTLGILSASSGFTTKGVRTALSSIYPMALVTLNGPAGRIEGATTAMSKPDASSALRQLAIRGFVWNRAAVPFIGKFIVAKKHYDMQVVEVDSPAEYTIQLLWDGESLPATDTATEASN